MQSVEVERHFAAPIEAVWSAYTDHARWSEWAGFSKSWLEVEGSPDRNGTGCIRAFGSGGVTAYEEILDFEAPKRLTYRVVRGGLPMKNHLGEVILSPDSGGTLLTWRCRFDSKIPGFGGLMKLFVTRFFRNALAGLESHAFPSRRP